ncbi:MAG TPA: DUF4157 domain-containing protein [Woeseiaceae bacterium]
MVESLARSRSRKVRRGEPVEIFFYDLRMSEREQNQTHTVAVANPGSAPGGLLQRKCGCGNHTVAGGECKECGKKRNVRQSESPSQGATRAPIMQRKLSVGASHDPLEQEADRIAYQVVGGSPHSAPTGSPPCIQRNAGHAIQGTESAPASVETVLLSSGRPLDLALRHDMENRFGYDFSRVRVHSDSAAEQSARDVNANAYTVGQRIVFGAGRFTPGTHEGRRLIAHELTHVVQQSGSEANHVGRATEARGLVSRATDRIIQRDLAIEPPRPNAEGRVLTSAQIAAAIAFNNQVLGSIANSVDIIEMIRDVVGVSPLPAVVDEDFVNGVVRWQANFGLAQDGRLGPTTARPLFREIGAEGVGRGELLANPQYAPAGPINVAAVAAGARATHFDLSAGFRSDPASGIFPSCCEVRQEIQWDAAYAAANVAAGADPVPHGGFPAAHPADTWIEDRDPADMRYGWRSGAHSDPGPGDHYVDLRGRQNQAFGHRYVGEDNPTDNPPYAQGSWRFRLGVYDMCNGNRLLRYSPTLVVNWL